MSRRAAVSLAAIVVFPALWWLVILGKFPLALFWAIAGLSLAAFVIYGLDKRAAMRGAPRTRESTLQFLALFGGWPGALLAQQVFRHKSAKRSFQLTFWFMVLLNCSAVGILLAVAGAL